MTNHASREAARRLPGLCEPGSKDLQETEAEGNFRIVQFWADILERIKFTILREGIRIRGPKIPTFSFIASGSPDFNIPTIQLNCEVFADPLTVIAAFVWQEADYEEDPPF
jgi:hypothetical protein